jgi:hypothetical protein
MSTLSAVPSQRRRWSLRVGVIAALVVSAVPASAAVIVKNFMTVDVNRASACLTKVAGLDTATTGDAIARNLTQTTNTSTGTEAGPVPLLNEKVTFQGYRGDRLIVTDGIRIQNTCTYAVNVFLQAEASPFTGSTATSGNWTDLSMKVFLGLKTPATSGGPAASGINFATALDWDSAPIVVTPPATGGLTGSFPGVVANATTGTFQILAGKEVQIGYQVDTGAAATSPAAGSTTAVTGTLNYTVNATKV